MHNKFLVTKMETVKKICALDLKKVVPEKNALNKRKIGK
jgi:hypothetical protein